MNFGFDLEGTLDADAHVFGTLCSALMAAGHGVYVITAYYCPFGEERDPEQELIRDAQLAAIGFLQGTHYTNIVYAPGWTAETQAEQKRHACEVMNVALMFEDRSDFTSVISRTTRCLLMQPRS